MPDVSVRRTAECGELGWLLVAYEAASERLNHTQSKSRKLCTAQIILAILGKGSNIVLELIRLKTDEN